MCSTLGRHGVVCSSIVVAFAVGRKQWKQNNKSR